MSGYGQFCPVAKAMELLDERWTMLVVRGNPGVKVVAPKSGSGTQTRGLACHKCDLDVDRSRRPGSSGRLGPHS